MGLSILGLKERTANMKSRHLMEHLIYAVHDALPKISPALSTTLYRSNEKAVRELVVASLPDPPPPNASGDNVPLQLHSGRLDGDVQLYNS